MKLGKRLKGKVRRARWREKRAVGRVREAQSHRTTAFWEAKLAQFRKHRRIERASNRRWGGSRRITNRVIRIVGNRALVTSRKRIETYGNPGSDHHVSQTKADAVDFGIGNAYSLAGEIARKLGGSWDGDYDSFVIDGYRVQIIAGTHGTGPHLHVGVRRV